MWFRLREGCPYGALGLMTLLDEGLAVFLFGLEKGVGLVWFGLVGKVRCLEKTGDCHEG